MGQPPNLTPNTTGPAGPTSWKGDRLTLLFQTGLYGMADPGPGGNRCPVEMAEALLDAGCPIIQLRMKDAGADRFLQTAMTIRPLTRAKGAALLINDRVDIALICGADGVHLGQEDIPVEKARELLGEQALIGLSTHNVDQVRSAREHGLADYLGFGPVFPSLTKAGVRRERGVELLGAAVEVARGLPIVGIGGINMDNIKTVLEAGCHAGAPIGAITEQADLFEATRRMVAVAQRSRTPG